MKSGSAEKKTGWRYEMKGKCRTVLITGSEPSHKFYYEGRLTDWTKVVVISGWGC